ncbi:GDSL-type esterase/lipase family protein [Actinoallomurus soli]|uniref:GDSL-type esterase/lipase family protein n=1 Tax=Actinoallomurus soli TaxID=2952535 RepID=UPI00209365DA|nr:GDSL-type esterase/lipase family protein [Actinoallomurus soli]MCO5973599.1 GDSL-type esterase/lipase family protein [Actinoallomurus soli]
MNTEQNLITTPVTAAMLRGALDVERTAHGLLPHRLPARARRQIPDDQLAVAEAQPSGVRLVFRTRATTIELETLPTKRVYRGFPAPADGAYDLLVDGRLAAQATVPGGNLRTIVDMVTQAAELREGRPGTARFTDLPPRDKAIEIWLPHAEITEVIALRTDAPVEPATDDGRRVWLHHGSSISHGSNADHPTATWPALAAAQGGVDLVNLGFSGSALLDPFTARAMRDTPADLISIKIGINIVNADAMRLRAFTPAVHGFLDTIREGHPTTPLLVVSPILCPVQEDTPGPLMPDLSEGTLRFKAMGDPAERAVGRLTLNVIRDELARIVQERASDDSNLHYLDGRDLYGEKDYAELPLPDEIHPDPAGHRRIAENFARLVFGAEGLSFT